MKQLWVRIASESSIVSPMNMTTDALPRHDQNILRISCFIKGFAENK